MKHPMTLKQRVNIRAILANPVQRQDLMTATIQATQAVAGIDTTKDQAARAYRAAAEPRDQGGHHASRA